MLPRDFELYSIHQLFVRVVRKFCQKNESLLKKLLEIYSKPIENYQNVNLFTVKAYIVSIFYEFERENPKLINETFELTLNLLEFSLNFPIFNQKNFP